MKLTKYRNTARRQWGRVTNAFNVALAALAVALTTTPMLALATPADPGAAIEAEITSAKTVIGGILVVLAGIVGLFILWSYLKRAR